MLEAWGSNSYGEATVKGVYHTDREGQVQINREENPRQQVCEENETHSVQENRRVRRNDWGAQLN